MKKVNTAESTKRNKLGYMNKSGAEYEFAHVHLIRLGPQAALVTAINWAAGEDSLEWAWLVLV